MGASERGLREKGFFRNDNFFDARGIILASYKTILGGIRIDVSDKRILTLL
jgi:hypothetical protein